MITNNNTPPNESPVYSQSPVPLGHASVEFNFFDIVLILKRQWGLVLFGILFCLFLGALFHAQSERLYSSKALLYIVERNLQAAVEPGSTSVYSNVQGYFAVFAHCNHQFFHDYSGSL
jgi:Uncharacterized protein involved in exopolysaccharide biosynthesis